MEIHVDGVNYIIQFLSRLSKIQTTFSHWTFKWQHSDDDNQDVATKVAAVAV